MKSTQGGENNEEATRKGQEGALRKAEITRRGQDERNSILSTLIPWSAVHSRGPSYVVNID